VTFAILKEKFPEGLEEETTDETESIQ